MEQLSSNKRIAKNTIMLYVRMIINLAIGLYASRVILQTLGVSDYGLYGVVGGIVAMFGFFNGSMSSATSRFLSYELGGGDRQKLRETFSSALLLHFAIAILITLICETFGIWFLENKLVVPEGRLYAARWVLQFSICTMFFQVIQVPFNAAIISHERMSVYAYIEIGKSLLMLLIVYLLTIGQFDKLILYAILTSIVYVIIFFLYMFYSIKNFEECSFRIVWNKSILKTMLSYTGWQVYGNFSIMAITQGVNMLMNMFFGTLMNAAYDIAKRVEGLVMQLSTNFTTAMRPQIVKSYSAMEFTRTYSLMCNAMRVTFVLMLIICAPLMIESEYVLRLWLGVIPDYAVVLLRLSLVWNLMVALTTGYADVSNATGDIKIPGLLSGTMYLSIFPMTFLAYKLGAPFWVPFVLNIMAVMLAPLYTCLPIKKHLPNFSWWKHVFSEILRCYFIMIVVLGVSYYITTYIDESFLRLILTTAVSSVLTCSLSYFILFPKEIRVKFIAYAMSKLHR